MEVTVMPNPASVEKQQGLNQVVINKVQRMVEGKRQGVMETIARLLDEGKIAQDFIAPIGVNLRGKEKQPVISFRAADRVQMTMPEGNFSLHGNAISQISEKMGVPAKYLRELSGGDVWQKQLCATILNEHSGWTARTRVLIRAVGMEVRGVLSDSYRRLNSVDILTAFIREAANQGAVVSDAYMNDTKVWCETILPTPIEIPTRKNGTVIIFAGARFSTSDYGNGSVDMRSFLLNGACLNGMVRESVMRQVHLGARLPDSLALSQKTYELDTQTTVSAVSDLTKGLYNKDTLMQKAIEIQGASEIDVDFDKELKQLVQKGGLLKSYHDASAAHFPFRLVFYAIDRLVKTDFELFHCILVTVNTEYDIHIAVHLRKTKESHNIVVFKIPTDFQIPPTRTSVSAPARSAWLRYSSSPAGYS